MAIEKKSLFTSTPATKSAPKTVSNPGIPTAADKLVAATGTTVTNAVVLETTPILLLARTEYCPALARVTLERVRELVADPVIAPPSAKLFPFICH